MISWESAVCDKLEQMMRRDRRCQKLNLQARLEQNV